MVEGTGDRGPWRHQEGLEWAERGWEAGVWVLTPTVMASAGGSERLSLLRACSGATQYFFKEFLLMYLCFKQRSPICWFCPQMLTIANSSQEWETQSGLSPEVAGNQVLEPSSPAASRSRYEQEAGAGKKQRQDLNPGMLWAVGVPSPVLTAASELEVHNAFPQPGQAQAGNIAVEEAAGRSPAAGNPTRFESSFPP